MEETATRRATTAVGHTKGGKDGLVSVAVGNTNTRAVWWRAASASSPAISDGKRQQQEDGASDEQPRLLGTAETQRLHDADAARAFIATLLQQMTEQASVDSEVDVAVVIGGGSVPAVERIIHESLVRIGRPFTTVLLVHQNQHEETADDDTRWRNVLVQELGLRVMPSPSWRVGKDRLCAALGALSFGESIFGAGALPQTASEPRRKTAWIVVDSGTALTVNLVLPSPESAWPEVGVFEGGLIMPGEGLMLRSLSSGTAQLPSLPYWPSSPAPLVGKTTEEAIRAGVRHLHLKGAVAVIKSLAAELEQRMRESQSHTQVRVVVTGGGGRNVTDALADEAKGYQPLYDPFLVHRGLLTVWRMRAMAPTN